MALTECQFQIRGLTLGCGTPYTVRGFNSFRHAARADQSGSRAWGHGSWSGAEWANEEAIDLNILIKGGDVAGWMDANDALAAALAPVGADASDVELRYVLGGREYLRYVRPRVYEPDPVHLGSGVVASVASLAALDPLRYSGQESTATVGLPQFEGGLTVPTTVPFVIGASLSEGAELLENEGTADTPLRLRINGPVVQPRIALLRPDGESEQLRFDTTLQAGQWLDVDTGARTVLLQGKTSRRAQTAGTFPLLPPGVSTLRFFAAAHNDDAEVTATWRSAWW